MALTKITVDIYNESGNSSAVYRIYVDQELLTERTWIWPGREMFVREHIEVDLIPGGHLLEIEQTQGDARLVPRRFTVNGVIKSPDNLSFIL